MAAKTVSAGAAKKGGKGAAAKMLKVTLVRSATGFNRTQGLTVRGMGLRKIRQTVELRDTPETRGMILKVRHLVSVAE